MKKILILSVIFILALGMLVAGTPRSYVQKVTLSDGTNPTVTNTGLTTSPDYFISATQTATGEVVSTATHAASQIRISLIGTGVNAFVGTTLQLGAYTAWVAGQEIVMFIRHIPTNQTATWTMTIPTGTSAINIQVPQIIPPAGGDPEYDLAVDSNYAGATILKGGLDTGFTTPHTFTGITAAIAGTYTVVLPHVVWTPSEYVYAGTADANIRFMGVRTPDPAMNPVPADLHEFHIAHDAVAAPYNLSWEAPIAGPAPTGYYLVWNGAPQVDLGNVISWITPAIAEGNYTWMVIPYITDPAKGTTRSMGPVKAVLKDTAAKGASTAAVNWHFTVIRDAPVDITVNADGTVSGPAGTVIVPAPVPPIFGGTDTGIPAVVNMITSTGTHDVIVTRPAGYPVEWFCWIVVAGNVYEGANPIITDTYTFANVNFDAKGDVFVVVDDNETLPVELSAFNADLTADLFVKLTWVTESETGLVGYRVYRSDVQDYASAVLVTPVMIDATNTSEQHTYNYTDREVEVNNTYWYWLEAVDYNNTTLHGPVSVEVLGNVTPPLPTTTVLGNAYPNPFKANTNISVAVKAGETATVTIYNILGQAVRTYKVSEGSHTINWDGRDSRNNNCGSGIYFYKMSSPSMNQTKKMVIVK